MLIPLLETERLIIRQFVIGDWPSVKPYVADPEVMKYIGDGVLSEDHSRIFVEENSGDSAEAFPVILKDRNTLVGHMILHPWFAPQTYEIGWVIHPDHQRKGYATEASKCILKYAFDELKCHRVIATCQPENAASYRVMEKIGMKREGHFRKCIYRGDNHWWDEYFYAILEEEWYI
jgi:RimJ/RimL family protein N-acetyltransferase